MDKTYADTVRLLLAVTPAVFNNDILAMKGGTAINLSRSKDLADTKAFRKRRPTGFAALFQQDFRPGCFNAA